MKKSEGMVVKKYRKNSSFYFAGTVRGCIFTRIFHYIVLRIENEEVKVRFLQQDCLTRSEEKILEKISSIKKGDVVKVKYDDGYNLIGFA